MSWFIPQGLRYPKLGNTCVNEDFQKAGTDPYAWFLTGTEIPKETTQNAVVLPALEPNIFRI